MKDRKRKIWFKKSVAVYCGIGILTVLLNVAAWNSTAFSDWYIANIFPVWVNTYGRVTGIFPFSVGEWMLGTGVALVALALVFGVIWAVIGFVLLMYKIWRGRKRERNREICKLGVDMGALEPVGNCWGQGAEGQNRAVELVGNCQDQGAEGSNRALEPEENCQDQGAEGQNRAVDSGGLRNGRLTAFWNLTRNFYKFCAWTFLMVSFVMTLNCFILYHGSTFSEHYFGPGEDEYTLVELIRLYNMVAEQCNSLAKVMERDESGMVLYGGSIGKDGRCLDMADMARELMRQLGETYPQLDGYYPRPKALLSSDFMCQQHMQGYYFPFSMEANYNDVMHLLNIPSTMCHELAHLRGYIYEDEANFIGYLACIQSKDAVFRYAGYLSVLNYLNNDLYKAWENNRTVYEEAALLVSPVTVDAQVWEDNIFVSQEEWDRINRKALIDTEIVDAAADVFIDTNLKVNGIADGAVSYSRVVKLLLQYYRHMPMD